MECKNCGKQIDVRTEKKFCTGCGAEIGKEKPPPVIITRERAKGPKWITTQREAELDLRTRVFMLVSLAGFFIVFLVLQFIFSSAFLNFLMAIAGGFVIGAVGIFVISRSSDDLRNGINESIEFLPAVKPIRHFVESLCSTIPLIGSLPQEGGKPPDKKNSL